MFRENVLTNAEIVDRIATTMIPIAMNYERVQDSSTEESKFLTPLIKQRKQDQGVWIFSPEGKALGGFVGFGDMVGQMKRIIDDALKAHGGVKPRKAKVEETHPNRGIGVMSDGRMSLAAYVRRYGNTLFSNGITAPVISQVTFSAKEFESLAPRDAVRGAEWTLPEAVSKKFCRLTSPLCYQHAPQPEWVTAARIQGKVVSIQDGLARLSYEGHIASSHGKISDQEVKLSGEAFYDLKTKQLRSILIVGTGKLVWSEEPKKPATFHALAEWSLER